MKLKSRSLTLMLAVASFNASWLTAMAGPAETAPAAKAPASSWFSNLFDKKSPVTFSLQAQETYNDNIFLQPAKTYDYITAITPGVELQLGQKIIVDNGEALANVDLSAENGAGTSYFDLTYKPTIDIYASNSSLNTLDQFADATYVHQFTKLTLAIEQSYARLSDPTIQTAAVGSLINRDIYTTKANVNYIYSDKLATYGTFTQTVSNYESAAFADTTEWVGDYYFLYQLFPKLSVGLGPRIGFVDVQGSPNQTYQSGLARFVYEPTAKLTARLSVGAEDREYQSGISDKASFVYEAAGIYQPFDSTQVTLSTSRNLHASNSSIGQDYIATSVQLGVRQRFVQKVYVSMNVGYENDVYSFAAPGLVGIKRNDDYFFARPSVEWAANDWLTVNGYYQYSKDNSNINTVSFNQNQFSVGATLKY